MTELIILYWQGVVDGVGGAGTGGEEEPPMFTPYSKPYNAVWFSYFNDTSTIFQR